jgi:DNA repair photolyase
MLNEDGYSVKGCTIIYAPGGQAGEYARLATNPYRGCGHACIYCYVPATIRMTRKAFDTNVSPKDDFLPRLTADAEKYRAHGIREQVLLSFTTDPYNPIDVEHQLTRRVLLALREHGLGFCTLTKGGARAMRDIDLFRPERDAFASTLTTLDPDQSRTWEPKAALPEDRLATLRAFHGTGIFTWVSLEPVYDTAMTIRLIQETASYVDLFKVGRLNYHRAARAINWCQFTEDVLRVVTDLGKQHYIKHDLQPFLPTGYANPRHVTQARTHHTNTSA